MLDPVLPADPVEEHLHRRGEEPVGEHLAVVGQDLLRHTVDSIAPASAAHTDRVRSPAHQPRADTVPGMIIDPGHALASELPSASRNPPTTSICHSSIGRPRSQRFHPPSPTSPLLGLTQSRPDQTPVHRGLARSPTRPARDLERDPPRTPPRMHPPQLQHRRLHHGRHLMRTRHRPMRAIHQTLEARGLIPGLPRADRLPRHPDLSGDVRHRRTRPDHREHRVISLLGHAQLPHPGSVKNQPE